MHELCIDGIKAVEYDLDGFYDNMRQVIILIEYDVPYRIGNYSVKSELIKNVINVARNNGLKKTEDSIEDYGQHFYFVFKHNETWMRKL